MSYSSSLAPSPSPLPMRINYFLNSANQRSQRDFFVGCFIGLIEVYINQPLVNWKNLRQQQTGKIRPIWQTTRQPWQQKLRGAYSGVTANAAGSPITGLQFWTADVLTRYCGQHHFNQLPLYQQCAIALVGGAVAAPLANVTELLMTVQQREVRCHTSTDPSPTYFQTMKKLWAQDGWRLCSRGLAGTLCRDMGFSVSYAAVFPYLKKRIETHTGTLSPLLITISSGIGAGLFAAVTTHPFDTWKTRRQVNMPIDFWPLECRARIQHAFQQIYRRKRIASHCLTIFQQLVREPYKGFAIRCPRIASAVVIIGSLQQYSKQLLTKDTK